jgi:hypothetical protein
MGAKVLKAGRKAAILRKYGVSITRYPPPQAAKQASAVGKTVPPTCTQRPAMKFCRIKPPLARCLHRLPGPQGSMAGPGANVAAAAALLLRVGAGAAFLTALAGLFATDFLLAGAAAFFFGAFLGAAAFFLAVLMDVAIFFD